MKTKRYIKLMLKLWSVVIFFFVCVDMVYANDAGFKLLNQMIRSYERVKIYNDNGTVKLQYVRNGKYGEFRPALVFKTEYFFNGDFTFEWGKDNESLHVRGNSISLKNNLIKKRINNDEEVVSNMNSALSGVSGISEGSSYLVTKYLLSDVPCISPSNIANIEIEKIRKTKRYNFKLKVTFNNGAVDYFWLNKNYYITKHLSSFKREDDVIVNTETTVYPQVK